MNDVFQKRVRAAAVAGWWTLLIAVIFLAIQWIAYQWIDISSARLDKCGGSKRFGAEIRIGRSSKNLVLDHGDIQDVHLADGAHGRLADTVGAAIAETCRRFVTN